MFDVMMDVGGVAELAASEAPPPGGDCEDHFQPGALVLSSNKDRIASDETGASLPVGSNRRVRENPGMFKLVYPAA